MENPNTTLSKSWLLFGASTLGMLAFAGLYFFDPKTAQVVQPVPNNVTNTVVQTNEIVREVPKEVERIVKVPADIPNDYVTAMNLYQRMTNATYTGEDEILFDMKDVRVECVLDDSMKKVVTEDEVKAKFELALRRNNVPVNPNSLNVVQVVMDGFFDSTYQSILNFSIKCGVVEHQWIFRGGDCHSATVRVWEKGGKFGTVGRANANDFLLNDVEKEAEIFANDFLSANSKPQNHHDIFDDLAPSTNALQK